MTNAFRVWPSLCLACCGTMLLAACISTEPAKRAPNINLSAEHMSFEEDDSSDLKVDLGLSLTTNESDSLENLEVLPGLRVRSVRSGGPAALAGIKAGDIILSLNGSDTNQLDSFNALVEVLDSDTLTIKARRGTSVFATQLTRPAPLLKSTPKELYRHDPVLTRAGYETQILKNQNNQTSVTAAQVVEISTDSPLPKAGVALADVITAIDGNAVESAQDLINRLHNNYRPGDRVRFSVLTPGENGFASRDISVKLWDPGTRINEVTLIPLFSYKSSLAPDRNEFKFLTLLGFSVFSYSRDEVEREYNLLHLIKFSSGAGYLVEEDAGGEEP